MTIQNVVGGLWIPSVPNFNTNVQPTLDPLIISAAGEKIAFVFTIPKTGTLDTIAFHGTDPIMGTNAVIKFSFQDLDATGKPDGTADQYRTFLWTDPEPVDFWFVPGILSDDGTDTGVKRTVTRGDRIAFVMEWDTFVAASTFGVNYLVAGGVGSFNYPNTIWQYIAAAWTNFDDGVPLFSLKYDDETYQFIPGCVPIVGVANRNSDGDTPYIETGMAVSFPAPLLVGGVKVRYTSDYTFDVVLYNSDLYTVLETVEVVGDGGQHYVTVLFSEDRLFGGNEVYRIALLPRDPAERVTIFYYDISDAALLNAIEGGAAFYYTERLGSGTWVDTFTRRPWMSLLVTGLDHHTG